MPSTPSLLAKVAADHPKLQFTPGDAYKWDPRTNTVHIGPPPLDSAALLHELAHALLGHDTYNKDINLIEMERDAWDYATTTLGAHYSVTISDDHVQDSLDSYRDWLHARSTCPQCAATGIQTQQSNYHCLACRASWTANDARIKALRRYRQQ